MINSNISYHELKSHVVLISLATYSTVALILPLQMDIDQII